MTPLDKQAFFLLYDTPDNNAKVQVVVRDETIWMTQKAMAALFDVNVPAISKHLKSARTHHRNLINNNKIKPTKHFI